MSYLSDNAYDINHPLVQTLEKIRQYMIITKMRFSSYPYEFDCTKEAHTEIIMAFCDGHRLIKEQHFDEVYGLKLIRSDHSNTYDPDLESKIDMQQIVFQLGDSYYRLHTSCTSFDDNEGWNWDKLEQVVPDGSSTKTFYKKV